MKTYKKFHDVFSKLNSLDSKVYCMSIHNSPRLSFQIEDELIIGNLNHSKQSKILIENSKKMVSDYSFVIKIVNRFNYEREINETFYSVYFNEKADGTTLCYEVLESILTKKDSSKLQN